MYKIDFEIKTILPMEVNTAHAIKSQVEEIYSKLNLATGSYVINGSLKITLSGTNELLLKLIGFGFFQDICDFTEVQRKFKQVLGEELSKCYKDIHTVEMEVVYIKITNSNPFHFLFIMLKEKIQRGFGSFIQRILG